MKRLLKKILNIVLLILFFFLPKSTKTGSTSVWTNIRNIIYSKWISLKFGNTKLRFNKPVNYLKGCEYFKIDDNSSFGKFVVLTAWDRYEGESFLPKVNIGKNCNFGDFLHLTCINEITIGDNCLTGRWVTISDNNHGSIDKENLNQPPGERKLISKGPIIIGSNVWIGDKATILGGVTIGDSSIVAANAVVTKDVPPFSIVTGNPAKVMKRV